MFECFTDTPPKLWKKLSSASAWPRFDSLVVLTSLMLQSFISFESMARTTQLNCPLPMTLSDPILTYRLHSGVAETSLSGILLVEFLPTSTSSIQDRDELGDVSLDSMISLQLSSHFFGRMVIKIPLFVVVSGIGTSRGRCEWFRAWKHQLFELRSSAKLRSQSNRTTAMIVWSI